MPLHEMVTLQVLKQGCQILGWDCRLRAFLKNLFCKLPRTPSGDPMNLICPQGSWCQFLAYSDHQSLSYLLNLKKASKETNFNSGELCRIMLNTVFMTQLNIILGRKRRAAVCSFIVEKNGMLRANPTQVLDTETDSFKTNIIESTVSPVNIRNWSIGFLSVLEQLNKHY